VGARGGFFSCFLSSQQVPNVFPMGALNFTLLSSHMFCPKCSPFHLYSWAKGRGTPHSIESSILQSLHSFIVVLWWADQIPEKKDGLVKGIAQAKNGGELFWEEKFHAANGKAQAHTQGALHFFLLSLGGGLEEDIFQFSWVPTMFPSRFQ